MEEQKEQLFDFLYTQDDLHAAVMLLREFFEDYFFTKNSGDIDNTFASFAKKHKYPGHVVDAIMSLKKEFMLSFTKENLHEKLDGFLRKAKEHKHMTIYTPKEFTASEYITIGTWVRTEIDKHLLLDLRTDPITIGGCAFVWNGVRHDFSLANFFEKKHEEILSLVTNYDKRQTLTQ